MPNNPCLKVMPVRLNEWLILRSMTTMVMVVVGGVTGSNLGYEVEDSRDRLGLPEAVAL